MVDIGTYERSWRLVPRHGWAHGSHHVVADPVLQGLGGNSITRLFDRDLARLGDGSPNAPSPTLTFSPH
jgi:hypothetical protein